MIARGFNNLATQFRRLVPLLLLIYIPLFLLLLTLVCCCRLNHIPLSFLTRAPLAVVETELLKIQQHPEAGIYALAELKLPLYTGAIASLGILLWTATAAITAFAFCLLKKRPAPLLPPAFFLSTALLSTALLLDDLFLFHERLLPHLLNLNDHHLIAACAFCLLLYFLRWFKTLRQTNFLLLGIALLCFAMALAVDWLPLAPPIQHLFEDGAKITGIASWTGYHIATACAACRP